MDEILARADEAFQQHDYDTALAAYKEAFDAISRQPSSYHWEKKGDGVLLRIADTMDCRGQWVDALMCLDRLKDRAQKGRDRRLELEVLLRSGKILSKRSKWKEASAKYSEAMGIAEKQESRYFEALCLYGLAYVCWRQGDMNEARKKAEEALQLLGDEDPDNLRGQALILLATLHDNRGETQRAIDTFQEGIRVSEEAGDLHELARAYNNLGEVYKAMEDYANATEQYEECVKTCQRSNDKHTEAYGLTNAAECQVRTGHLDMAEENVARAENILQTLDDTYAAAFTHYVRGLIAHRRGDGKETRREYGKAIDTLVRLKTPYDLGIVYYDYGNALADLGHPEEAVEAYRKARGYCCTADSQGYLKKVEEKLRELG